MNLRRCQWTHPNEHDLELKGDQQEKMQWEAEEIFFFFFKKKHITNK